MSELHHECGVAAVYHLPNGEPSSLGPGHGPEQISRLMPRMLLDIQNRGQLAAGMTSYNPMRAQLIDTHKEVGTVTEVFRLSHGGKRESLMQEYAGRAAIGHVRYATCGKDDRSYAQPFERHHLQKAQMVQFCVQRATGELWRIACSRLLAMTTTITWRGKPIPRSLLHSRSVVSLAGKIGIDLLDVMRNVARQFDGAYSLALLNANGDMLVARDPLGIKPMCYAIEGPLFAAASESVALANLGFARSSIKSLEPGKAIVITDGKLRIGTFADTERNAHCFFEWIYFANVASTLDGRSVYLPGRRWAKNSPAWNSSRGGSRSTATRSSCRYRIRARQPLTPWHLASRSPVARV